ncbi:hypothetical protein SHKM778_06040 [Streptomyces sp. KM77-8]|uniref:Carboxylesterase type B domain-containing protein n=1 Tax=Streptomyces haneummycinicus TaxID=3074435 RepID=A0AAT9HA57_9ACTN
MCALAFGAPTDALGGFFMPSDTSEPTTTYRALLGNREFAGLYVSFTLTVAASTLSGFALGTLVDARTGSPFLTAVSMHGATFATVLGAMTLMSVADGNRPRRTLVALQCVSLLGVAAQAIPGLPLAVRFALLLVLGFFQSLGTGTRMGLLAEVVPASAYVPARSLMNITSGGTAVLGYALGAVLLRYLSPQGVFATAAALTGAGLVVVATTVRERSIRPPRRPGLRQTWTTNTALLSRSGPRALLLNLWVPNGLIVGCEALFISYAPGHAGILLAAGSAGMLLGDLTVGRLLTAERRRRCAFALRLLLAAPYLLFVLHPPCRWRRPPCSWPVPVSPPPSPPGTAPGTDPRPGPRPGPGRRVGRPYDVAGIGAALAGGIAQHLTPPRRSPRSPRSPSPSRSSPAPSWPTPEASSGRGCASTTPGPVADRLLAGSPDPYACLHVETDSTRSHRRRSRPGRHGHHERGGRPGTPRAADGPSVVGTDKGAVRGTVTDIARVFQGIPYAAPPTGRHRWAPPRPPPGGTVRWTPPRPAPPAPRRASCPRPDPTPTTRTASPSTSRPRAPPLPDGPGP